MPRKIKDGPTPRVWAVFFYICSMAIDNRPIGFFDSGVGGTSIWKEVHALLPLESTIYLADSANAPYGQRSKEEIIALSEKNTEVLLSMGCKIIVVACNTATTNAIQELRAKYAIPFIGIEPALKPAAHRSHTQVIGILATRGTLNSELFNRAVETYPDTKIIEQVGHGLVQLIENGDIDSPEMDELLHTYLDPMIAEDIDYLVLGCSHYPYLIPKIKNMLPAHVKIIDSGEATARQTRNILQQNELLGQNANPFHRFYTNADPKVLTAILNGLYAVEQKLF